MTNTDSEAASFDPESGYDREVVERVWSFAQIIPGNDPEVWRKDEFGAWIHKSDRGNRHSEFGWEIAECGYGLRGSGVTPLRPMQWQNYLDFMVADRQRVMVRAEGLHNVRKLV